MAESLIEPIKVFMEKYDQAVLAKLTERLDANSAAAGNIAMEAWRSVLSGPAGSASGQPPGDITGDLKNSLNVRTYARRRNFSGFIIKPRTKKMQSILGRLSRGYYGTDHLGRTYHEPARPSVARAWAESRQAVMATLFR